MHVEGPHGAFSIDQDEGPGFGLIAGGVGIAGLISMLRTMADRNDVRPVLLVYGNGEWDDVVTRHLPDGYTRWQYFSCGPDAMMDAAEAARVGLGVPAQRVHTERFDMA